MKMSSQRQPKRAKLKAKKKKEGSRDYKELLDQFMRHGLLGLRG